MDTGENGATGQALGEAMTDGITNGSLARLDRVEEDVREALAWQRALGPATDVKAAIEAARKNAMRLQIVWSILAAVLGVALTLGVQYARTQIQSPAQAQVPTSYQRHPGPVSTGPGDVAMLTRIVMALDTYPQDRTDGRWWTRAGKPTVRGLEEAMGLPEYTLRAWMRDAALAAREARERGP